MKTFGLYYTQKQLILNLVLNIPMEPKLLMDDWRGNSELHRAEKLRLGMGEMAVIMMVSFSSERDPEIYISHAFILCAVLGPRTDNEVHSKCRA